MARDWQIHRPKLPARLQKPVKDPYKETQLDERISSTSISQGKHDGNAKTSHQNSSVSTMQLSRDSTWTLTAILPVTSFIKPSTGDSCAIDFEIVRINVYSREPQLKPRTIISHEGRASVVLRVCMQPSINSDQSCQEAEASFCELPLRQ